MSVGCTRCVFRLFYAAIHHLKVHFYVALVEFLEIIELVQWSAGHVLTVTSRDRSFVAARQFFQFLSISDSHVTSQLVMIEKFSTLNWLSAQIISGQFENWPTTMIKSNLIALFSSFHSSSKNINSIYWIESEVNWKKKSYL